jgi:propionyl-CoA carboxylase beta chain
VDRRGGVGGLPGAHLAGTLETFSHPYAAAQRGFVDEVILPRQTRTRLIRALATLDSKRDRNPPKKHGNIPL